MDSLKQVLENRNIMISLHYYGTQDLATSWEVKTIIENSGFFDDLYPDYPLIEMLSFDDYYLYLLSLKLANMKEIVPILVHEEHKAFITKLSGYAEKAINAISIGDVIKYINNNIQDIFDKDNTTHDVRSVSLDIIAKYSNGISRNVFAFLCKDYGYLLIDRFDQFEKTFELYPDLFESIYPTGHLEEIKSFRLEKTLDIWCHIIQKGKSSLKGIVASRIDVLEKDIKKLSTEANINNILQVEGTIRMFHLFLQRIKSPKANEFAEYSKAAEDLLSKNILERGQIFQYEIPVNEIVNQWKKTENWVKRLLYLTHDFKEENGMITCISRLSKGPDKKHPLIDFVSTNIPTDKFFTMSHQDTLSVIANVGTGTMVGIVRDQDTLGDYISLVMSAVSLITERLNAGGEQLQNDLEMWSALIQIVANNMEINSHALNGMCYGASMYTCALSEKLLRLLYMYLVKDEKYVPINKATLGELLVVNNAYMLDIFGENHIKNLSFFLQRSLPSNVGQNIRNNLAHWANYTVSAMTPLFVAKMLWMFTDILNTVFWYCLKDAVNEE